MTTAAQVRVQTIGAILKATLPDERTKVIDLTRRSLAMRRAATRARLIPSNEELARRSTQRLRQTTVAPSATTPRYAGCASGWKRRLLRPWEPLESVHHERQESTQSRSLVRVHSRIVAGHVMR